MRSCMLALALLAAASGSAAMAQAGALPKAGAMLVSSDGKRIGRIDRILNDRDGKALTASVIHDSRFVAVPVSTLSLSEDGRAVTTLSRKEVSALR